MQLLADGRLILLAAALAPVIGLLAILAITMLIVRPFKQVIEQTRQVAMQGMSNNLREMVDQLQTGGSPISVSAQSLSTITEQTREGVNGQHLETDQVTPVMSEMTTTVHEVARYRRSILGGHGRDDGRDGCLEHSAGRAERRTAGHERVFSLVFFGLKLPSVLTSSSAKVSRRYALAAQRSSIASSP